ncbi:hypothetical protein MFFC18_49540 [Mariniblastus fucicola]|uniref:Uncharacterized protein n=1 Tax=Mariniblastus fucicola TaxID=980251 RepID=A0A5B9PRA4_9BACT|nr:hypothetical protein MFFC18_49540 [Mariniblastus fucicola]
MQKLPSDVQFGACTSLTLRVMISRLLSNLLQFNTDHVQELS